MKLRQYQIDAFSDRLFAGNPAAVVALPAWLEDRQLQAIATENNLSETAFYVPGASGYALRWFTPAAEVDLCGHATLATAHVLFQHEAVSAAHVTFTTRSGTLTVARAGEQLAMRFPARSPVPCRAPDALLRALGEPPAQVLAADDYVVVYAAAPTVRALAPDMHLLRQVGLRGVAVTAPGETADFVSRFFAPKLDVPEDPVTGSAHCELAPYWGERLHKETMQALQCSPRGGRVDCRLSGEHVVLSGRAVTFMTGTIHVD